MTNFSILDPHLNQSVCSSARTAADRFIRQALSPFRSQLARVAVEGLRAKANKARLSGWNGAFPSWEPVDGVYPLPDKSLPIVGVDGSQIYPDPTQPVQWAYMQALAYNDGNDPLIQTDYIDLEGLAGGTVQRFDLPEDLLPYCRDLKALVDYLRALLELKTAVKADGLFPGHITLLDMPLAVWPPYSQNKLQRQRLHNQFYSLLNRLQGRPVAGVISSPTSSYLHQMISLSIQSPNVCNQRSTFQDRFFLMEYLQPGERTAIFELSGGGNDAVPPRQAALFFFYLKINDYELVRVEIPAWAAKNEQMIAQIQASIYQDSQALGYSQALSRAHHLVSITAKTAGEFKHLASALFFDSPNQVGLSAKMRMKLGWEES